MDTEDEIFKSSYWQEWFSLDELTNSIPNQFQCGLSAHQLHFTCLSAMTESLGIGTNVGLIYFVHLPSYNLMRLKCENVSSSITSISSIKSVDDMVAGGCVTGYISIFQIPIVPNSTGKLKAPMFESMKPPKRFTVKIHFHSISSLQWSKNSMKLFSGDVDGNVGFTEINYENYTCTGKLLFKLDSKIVQLSYSSQYLAASCLEKCILFDARNSEMVQVGKKLRNPPGLYGCTFASSLDIPSKDVIFCARPGNKIWSAGFDGVVLFSYIHKKFPSDVQIRLLNEDFSENSSISFGYLHHFRDSVIISHSVNCIVILDVKQQKILGFSSSFGNSIIDVSANESEVFILDNNRKIRCLSISKPLFGQEKLRTSGNLYDGQYFESLVPNKQLIQSFVKIKESVISKIATIANPTILCGEKQNPSNTMDSQPAPSQSASDVIDMDNSKKLEPKECYKDEKELGEEPDSKECHNLVLETSLRKKLSPKQVLNVTKNESSDDLVHHNEESYPTSWQESELTEDTSLSEIKSNIKAKEKMLADILDISCLKMDHCTANNICSINDVSENRSLNKFKLSTYSDDFKFDSGGSIEKSELKKIILDIDKIPSKSKIDSVLNSLEVGTTELSYGPPSGSSSNVPGNSLSSESVPAPNNNNRFIPAVTTEEEPSPESLAGNWNKHFIPSRFFSMVGLLNEEIFCFVDKFAIFYSTKLIFNVNLKWTRKRLSFEAIEVVRGLASSLLLLAASGHLYKLEIRDLIHEEELRTKLISEKVRSVSTDEEVVWIITRGNTCETLRKSDESDPAYHKMRISCPRFVIRDLICGSMVVWALDKDRSIILRIGISESCPEGMTWSLMEDSDNRMIHLSNFDLGWKVDSQGQIFFKLLVKREYPRGFDKTWWQICQSDYMITSDRIVMASTRQHLWIADRNSNVVFSHQLEFLTGHQWNKVCDEVLNLVSGAGIYHSYGFLFGIKRSGQLFALNPTNSTILVIISTKKF